MLSTGSSFPREQGGDADESGSVVAPQWFNTAGLQVAGDQCRLLLGSAPHTPRIALPFSKVALSADFADMKGYLSTPIAGISTMNSQLINSNTLNASDIYADYTQSQQVDTETLTSNGVPIRCDWNATSTDLPTIQLINNPFQTKSNGDGTKAGFDIGSVFIGAAEGLAGDALLYLARSAGGWLLDAAQSGLSMMNGYLALSETGLSVGADAASFGTAAAGDAAIFEAGEGLVLASSASEAASLFSSAGLLAEGGVGFSSDLGEVAQGLLTGIENSSGSFVEEAMPDFFDTLLGSSRWVSL